MANKSVLLIILCGFILAAFPCRDTEVTFLDVGQGDGIFLKSGGETALIDGGSSSDKQIGKNVLESFLKSKAVGRIDRAFITHADADHNNGILYLLKESSICIDNLYLPVCAEGDEKYDDIILCFGGNVNYIGSGEAIPFGRGCFYCLSPEHNYASADINDQSMVLTYEEENFKALFTGDASVKIEERICETSIKHLDNITVLKCGHHGSKTSTGQELLSAAIPAYAVLSYGQGNRYGHPNDETIERLEKYGLTDADNLFRTAESGAITVRTDGTRIKIEEYLGK